MTIDRDWAPFEILQENKLSLFSSAPRNLFWTVAEYAVRENQLAFFEAYSSLKL